MPGTRTLKRTGLVLLGICLVVACAPTPIQEPESGPPAAVTILPSPSLPEGAALASTVGPAEAESDSLTDGEFPAGTLTVSPSPTPASVSPMVGPTASPTASPEPLSGEEVLAWTVATDGAVYVLDRTYSVYELEPRSLAPVAQSPPLFEAGNGVMIDLLASQNHVFVSTSALSETLVLERGDLRLAARWDGHGPLALDGEQRLLLIPLGLEKGWPVGNFEIWAHDLHDLTGPPQLLLRQTGTSMEDLAVDAEARRLYLLTSNVGASPPHRGQTYEIYDLDSLDRIGSLAWERGSLTPPAIHPRTGELVGSRIGLNETRRLLVMNPGGQEVRSFDGLDGLPVLDPSGEWIYLLRPRGLWTLREQDLSVHGLLPFTGTPPRDAAISPDGQMLYLFGNGWLLARPAAEVRTLGIAMVSPMPAGWFATEPSASYAQPRLYVSPKMEVDGTAFVQIVNSLGTPMETYRSADGGQAWQLLPSLLEPGLAGAAYLGLSPDFDQDQVVTAQAGSTILRSSDGGVTWQPWQPMIAFTSERDGNREIYTLAADGSNVQRLTHDPGKDENAAWSPAWTRLAFQSNRGGNWNIYTVRADCSAFGADAQDGCDLRQLTSSPGDDLLPAWSPDGRSIAFVSTRDGNPEIYVMDRDGKNQQRLTFHPNGDWRPAWLPDCMSLVFVSDRGGSNDIYQMVVPAADAFPLASEPAMEAIIEGPADERDPAVVAGLVDRLLFLSDRDGFMRTYQWEPSGQPRAFAETDQPEAHPASLPGVYDEILVSVERGGDVDVYRAAFSGYAPLAPAPGYDGQPAAQATGWKPSIAASLAWIEEHAR